MFVSTELEQIITELREGQQQQTAAWQEVQQLCRRYAQMSLHSSYIESGQCVWVGRGQRDAYAEVFRDKLLQACERAFLEDALMGAAVDKALTRGT
jgi:hypothetical protein